nr:unnamed protein product [Callosobruchus analis]
MSTSRELCNLAEGVIRKVQEMESSLSLLKSFKEQFKHRKNMNKSKRRYLMWIDLESCFESRVRTGAIVNLNIKDPVEFFTRAKNEKELQRSLLKVNVIFLAKFIKPTSEEEDIKHFQTKNRVIDHNTDLDVHYDNHIQNNILTKLEEFQERDSGWSLDDDGGDDNIQIELSKNIKNFKGYYHFALIKDLSRLLRRQTTDLNNKRFYCVRCLNHFYSQETLNKHIFTCRKMNKTKITPPLGDEKF